MKDKKETVLSRTVSGLVQLPRRTILRFVLIVTIVGFILNSTTSQQIQGYMLYQLGMLTTLLNVLYIIRDIWEVNNKLAEQQTFFDLRYERERKSNKSYIVAYLVPAVITLFMYSILEIELDIARAIYYYTCLYSVLFFCMIGYMQYFYYVKYIYRLSDITKISDYKRDLDSVQKEFFYLYDKLHEYTITVSRMKVTSIILSVLYVAMCALEFISHSKVLETITNIMLTLITLEGLISMALIRFVMYKRIKKFTSTVLEDVSILPLITGNQD